MCEFTGNTNYDERQCKLCLEGDNTCLHCRAAQLETKLLQIQDSLKSKKELSTTDNIIINFLKEVDIFLYKATSEDASWRRVVVDLTHEKYVALVELEKERKQNV